MGQDHHHHLVGRTSDISIHESSFSFDLDEDLLQQKLQVYFGLSREAQYAGLFLFVMREKSVSEEAMKRVEGLEDAALAKLLKDFLNGLLCVLKDRKQNDVVGAPLLKSINMTLQRLNALLVASQYTEV